MESGLICEENGTPVTQLPMLMILGKVKSSSTVFPGENETTCWSSAVKAVPMEFVAHSLVSDSLS